MNSQTKNPPQVKKFRYVGEFYPHMFPSCIVYMLFLLCLCVSKVFHLIKLSKNLSLFSLVNSMVSVYLSTRALRSVMSTVIMSVFISSDPVLLIKRLHMFCVWRLYMKFLITLLNYI